MRAFWLAYGYRLAVGWHTEKGFGTKFVKIASAQLHTSSTQTKGTKFEQSIVRRAEFFHAVGWDGHSDQKVMGMAGHRQ